MKAGIDRDAEILEMRSYDDAITLAAVTAAINVLSLGLPDLLRELHTELKAVDNKHKTTTKNR
eukprot:5167177-Amphidinium_carterae.1